MTECTYRGIINKHNLYLYKVKAETINKGCGLLEFTNFVE